MPYIKQTAKKLLNLYPYAPQKKLGINYRFPSETETKRLKQSLISNYFSKFPEPFPVDNKEEVEKGFMWMDDHLTLRLESFRTRYVPFLNSVKNLKGSTVLDVGCGTGNSLVALAEAGARVYGIDIDAGSLAVAKDRCEIYQAEVTIDQCSATDIASLHPEVKFDFIIFNASLEHMFLEERLKSMQAAWNRLEKDGLFCIIECPNRLWYFDIHTAHLPFFDWLPHDLALMYCKLSPRQYIRDLIKLTPDKNTVENFLRIGRGMSFHEIDLAIGDVSGLNVRSALNEFILDNSNWLEKKRIKATVDNDYIEILSRVAGKKMHRGFFQPWLNLVIKK
jgi:ubiquinone/menaquinone biosynthesis C-methylase UbiE